ncbi:ABC transporter substrate-binding protein [Streptomyces reniochalinae]|uniref:ABC transporter substrate-binding protein n=1 Tax=Streptomyces reniochalinae TaxID=2250578 RepID=A0A367ERH0_9ACTN|nr:ABC transporter substrate-binding protein [Streptomyces reniochalinae]RCG20312.1 ABC transporter substrate-binding protein [Streptomyces reniochalinae]
MRSTTVSLLAGSVVLSLALAGCSSSDGGGSKASSRTRTVTDAGGTEVKVPDKPKRVVPLHYSATQPVLDLGFKPVGQGAFEKGIIPKDQAAEIEKIPVVARQEPKLEDIAALEPDLILAPNVYDEETLKALRDIAPVYTFTLRGGDRARWTQRTEEVAEALGVPEKADKLQAAFAKRQKGIAKKYGKVIKGKTVGVIGSYEENNFYAWGEKNMQGSLMVPLGFTWSRQESKIVKGQKEPEATLSNEKLASAVSDADVLFLDSNLRGQVNAFMKTVQKTSLYKQLPAVKNDHVYVGGKNTVAGYTDAHYTLDRVEDALKDLQAE